MERGICFSYSELFCKPKKTKDEIISIIKLLPFNETLKMLSVFANMERNNNESVKVKLKFAMQTYLFARTHGLNLGYEEIPQNTKLLEPENVSNMYFGEQLILFAYKLVVRYGEPDNIPIPSNFDIIDEIINLLVILADYMPKEDVADNINEYLWTMLYNNQERIPKYELARGYVILIENQSTINKYLDGFKTKYGLSVQNYLTIIFFFVEPLVDKNNFLGAKSSEETQRKFPSFFKNLVTSPQKLKDLFENNDDIFDFWDVSKLQENPFIEIGKAVIPICGQLVSANFFEYLFWKIAVSIKKLERDQYFTQFGTAFENYVHLLTENACGKNNYTFNYYDDKDLVSDGYIIVGDTMVILEVKSKEPDSESYLYNKAVETKIKEGNKLSQKIKDDIVKLLIAPVCQADRSYMKLLSANTDKYGFVARDKNIKKIIILSISREKMQPVKELYDKAKELFYNDETMYDETSHGNKVAYHTKLSCKKIVCALNINIYEYEKLCAILENIGFSEFVSIIMQASTSSASSCNLWYDIIDNIITDRNYGNIKSSFIEENFKKFVQFGLDI